ncbi:hypothetical protein [Sphingosinicella rhizophila]|uniref:Isopropylmalate isomerase n=1 Tax=Sphingosinicella rhizophila TaxID=3050082 RepID=A0ABU3Q2E6_9SPHN|nr:hypothetical protein [Sphingosinicella sp. GR2756]MDT9597594.1 hypothetical protein [Sphingosinicella sp. GR2756]
MSREPSYPQDAPIGVGKKAGSAKSGTPEGAKADLPPDAEKGDPNRAKQLMTGAAIGIGSAAIVAALLYANRSKRNDKGNS